MCIRDSGEGVQHLGCPLAELRGSAGIDPIAYGYDGGQRVELIVIGFSVIRNLCKICTSCIFGQFTAFIYIFQMLCHNAPVYIKKLCNGLLGQPNIVVLYSYLNAILMGCLLYTSRVHHHRDQRRQRNGFCISCKSRGRYGDSPDRNAKHRLPPQGVAGHQRRRDHREQ